MEFRILKSKLGTTVISAGIIDDIIGLIVLAVILQLGISGLEQLNYSTIGYSVLNIVLFLCGVVILDVFINRTSEKLTKHGNWFFNKIQTQEAGFAILLTSTIGLAYVAETVGIHFIVGVFFGGLIIYERVIGTKNFQKIRDVFAAITFGFFSPLFFAFIGTELSIKTIVENYILFSVIFMVAIIGKIAGGFIGGKIVGFSNSESMTIGYLVNSRE